MSEPIKDRLYNLLPAIYRIQDYKNQQALHSLLAVIESEFNAVQEDIENLYENWFIETCDPWVVPYIGDLLGVTHLNRPDSSVPIGGKEFNSYDLRSYVANTIAYRRRKGTATVLEQLAKDITGWDARAVEFFQLLTCTQHLNHIRPSCTTPDLRNINQLELLGGPFETTAHIADVHNIEKDQGKYNIPNIGLFLWRLQRYPVSMSTAYALAAPPEGRYTFSPLGNNIPLFNDPKPETEITHLAGEVNVRGILRRFPLCLELETRRKALSEGKEPYEVYFRSKNPVFKICFIDGNSEETLSPDEIMICNLSDWESNWSPPDSRNYTILDRDGNLKTGSTKVAVDPALGRLAVLNGIKPPEKIRVGYCYGFSADIGGGPYERRKNLVSISSLELALGTTIASSSPKEFLRVPSDKIKTIKEALNSWDKTKYTVIQIEDSQTYKEDLNIQIEDSSLIIQASNEKRPTIIGNIKVTGNEKSDLTLNGFLVSGQLIVDGNFLHIKISDCTFVPGIELNKSEEKNGDKFQPEKASITVDLGCSSLFLEIERSIVGPLRLPEEMAKLRISDSIIDASNPTSNPDYAISADDAGKNGPSTVIERSTIFGDVHVRELEASEVIFNDPVKVNRMQTGCVRFSYVPEGSEVPRCFRCQPQLALSEKAELSSLEELPEYEKILIKNRTKPVFTSIRYGEPGYTQLSANCSREIWTGAEDGSEMGVFCSLKEPQREANLRTALNEYLPFRLKAGFFYVS